MWADVTIFAIGLLICTIGSGFIGYLWGYGAAIERHKIKIFTRDKPAANGYDKGN